MNKCHICNDAIDSKVNLFVWKFHIFTNAHGTPSSGRVKSILNVYNRMKQLFDICIIDSIVEQIFQFWKNRIFTSSYKLRYYRKILPVIIGWILIILYNLTNLHKVDVETSLSHSVYLVRRLLVRYQSLPVSLTLIDRDTLISTTG